MGAKKYRIGVMHGDDIGLEIVPETVRVLQAGIDQEADLQVEFVTLPVGWTSFLEHGHSLPQETLDSLQDMDGFILGPIGHAAYPKDEPNCPNPHPILRKHFDLYANMRPVQTYAGLPSLHPQFDILVVRENNEGFQPDRNMIAGSGEFQPTVDSAYSIRVITRRGSERIARAAFGAAQRRQKHVTAIHKRTVFKLTDGLFMDTVAEVAGDYADVTLDDYQVDTAAMHIVMRPEQFDVVLCTNMFGDILSDLTAGLAGGLGMAPGLNVGDSQAMAQATHGSAPDITGKNIANPYAMIMSGQMLIDWLGARNDDQEMQRAAARVDAAVKHVLEEGATLTRDLGGSASTQEMGQAIVDACSTVSV